MTQFFQFGEWTTVGVATQVLQWILLCSLWSMMLVLLHAVGLLPTPHLMRPPNSSIYANGAMLDSYVRSMQKDLWARGTLYHFLHNQEGQWNSMLGALLLGLGGFVSEMDFRSVLIASLCWFCRMDNTGRSTWGVQQQAHFVLSKWTQTNPWLVSCSNSALSKGFQAVQCNHTAAVSKHVGYLNFGTSEVCLYQCKHFFPLRKSMATAIQLTRTNGNQSTAWLPQVLWRENAERLISQWRPSIILEAKLGHRHDIIRSVASLNLNSTAIYIYITCTFN